VKVGTLIQLSEYLMDLCMYACMCTCASGYDQYVCVNMHLLVEWL
jgi:hypothetical protein